MVKYEKVIYPTDYHNTMVSIRDFFIKKGYVEAYTQGLRSILAACEDPKTISTYKFSGIEFPLQQTSQMILELMLLEYKELSGIFCSTTSYRDEPNPIEGRHDKIFNMTEFEHVGNFEDLIKTGIELTEHLGFNGYKRFTYQELSDHYGVKELKAEHETKMWEEFGDVVIITDFPRFTSPFFNMSYKGDDIFNKADFIICGMETFGTAERSSDVNQMKESFYTISDGEYSKILFDRFGKDRVEEELNYYFSLPMRNRFGGGIGMSRLIKSLKLKKLI
jgi:aspartyl/asparaginyl-tRNA synthetase